MNNYSTYLRNDLFYRKIQVMMRVYFDSWTLFNHFLKQNDKTEQMSAQTNTIPIMTKMMAETDPITYEESR